MSDELNEQDPATPEPVATDPVETPAIDAAPPPDDPSTTDPAPSTGPARDAQGRFVGHKAAETEPATEPADANAAVADPAAPVDAPAVEPVAPQIPDGTPWSFKAGDRTYTFGDTRHVPGLGLVVPEATVETFRTALGRLAKYEAKADQWEAEKTRERESLAADREFTTHAATYWEQLAERCRQAEAANDERALSEVFAELLQFSRDMPRLKVEARASVLERQLQQITAAQQPTPEAQRKAAIEEADAVLGGWLTEYQQQHAKSGLTAADWQEVAQDVAIVLESLVAQADRDDPEAGIARGMYVLHEARARQVMDRAVARQVALAGQRVAAQRQQQVAAEQKKRTQAQITAPPVAAGTSTGTPPAAAAPTIRTADDLFRYIHS